MKTMKRAQVITLFFLLLVPMQGFASIESVGITVQGFNSTYCNSKNAECKFFEKIKARVPAKKNAIVHATKICQLLDGEVLEILNVQIKSDKWSVTAIAKLLCEANLAESEIKKLIEQGVIK